jgi:hypothetical protein
MEKNITKVINQLISLSLVILWVVTFPVYASDYDCDADTIDFNQGDVLSSELFTEIIDKINNNIVGMTQSDINGSWSCKTILGGAYGTYNGYSVDVNGFYTMTQTLTYTEVDSVTSRVLIENQMGFGISDIDANDCTVNIYQNKIKLSHTTNTSCFNHHGLWDIVKKSSTCFIQQHGNDSMSVCNKTEVPPDAPLNLYVTLAAISGSTDKKASLIWDAGDSTQANYDVQRKNTASGTFASIATPTDTNYTDTTIAWNNSYWYRVFAVNADGTSYGSNVQTITYSNTPPSINIPSTISVDENYGTASNFTTLSVSDADLVSIDTTGQTLTLTLGSQSPGNDASDFTLASDGGLSFNASPDYESPADYDTNNIYDLTLTATDGVETVSQDFSVVVLNVSE